MIQFTITIQQVTDRDVSVQVKNGDEPFTQLESRWGGMMQAALAEVLIPSMAKQLGGQIIGNLQKNKTRNG